MKNEVQSIDRIWMKGRKIIMGQVVSPMFFDGLYDYIDRVIINTLVEDKTIYSCEEEIASKEKLMTNPELAIEYKKMQQYRRKMQKAICLSSTMEEKVEAYEKNRKLPERFDRFITRIGKVTDNCVEVEIDLDAINDKTIVYLNTFCRNAKKRGQEIKLVVYRGMAEPIDRGRLIYLYNTDELEKLSRVNDISKRHFGHEIVLQSGPAFVELRQWTYAEVVEANNKVYKIAKDIMELDLSPLEAQLVIHKYASSFFFHKAEGASAEMTRSIMCVLSNQRSPMIVCGGYASIEKAITEKMIEMGYKGLKNQLFTCREVLNREKQPTFHCFNIVEVDDKKYKKKGKFLDDATADAPNEEMPFQQALNYYLLPISDLNKRKNKHSLEDFAMYMQEVVDYLAFEGVLKSKHKVKLAKVNKLTDVNKICEESRVFSIKGQGQAIDYQMLREVTFNTFNKLLAEIPEQRREIMINYELAMTVLFAKYNFHENAQNGFAQHAYSLTKKQFKDIQNFVFPDEEGFKKLQQQMLGEK